MLKTFFRVEQDTTQESLWYDKQGQFTGIIHTQYDFLGASKLQMPYDRELVGHISVADNLEHLYQWFTKEEIFRLQKSGYCVSEYQAADYKYYAPYQHTVINQATSTKVRSILLT